MRHPAVRKFGIPAVVAAPAFAMVLCGLALIGAFSACKSKPPADVPGEFTFHGQAVHPAAVSALYRSATGQIDLAAFKTGLEARQWEDQPGWWVTDFEENPVSGRSPFFAYVAFAGPITGEAELYILSVMFNADEPADVNNIVLLQKSGSWLSLVRVWTEGSACNGGISNQRIDNDNFLYSRELTPIDLLNLSVGIPLNLTPNEDLEASSESCAGLANYVYSLTRDREDLLSVRLYDEPVKDEKGRTERYRFQSCFNRIFNDYIARAKTALMPKEVDEFAVRFHDECVKPAVTVPVPAPVDK
jgi:hypothetical protein